MLLSAPFAGIVSRTGYHHPQSPPVRRIRYVRINGSSHCRITQHCFQSVQTVLLRQTLTQCRQFKPVVFRELRGAPFGFKQCADKLNTFRGVFCHVTAEIDKNHRNTRRFQLRQQVRTFHQPVGGFVHQYRIRRQCQQVFRCKSTVFAFRQNR